jgi:hypothetical protein
MKWSNPDIEKKWKELSTDQQLDVQLAMKQETEFNKKMFAEWDREYNSPDRVENRRIIADHIGRELFKNC